MASLMAYAMTSMDTVTGAALPPRLNRYGSTLISNLALSSVPTPSFISLTTVLKSGSIRCPMAMVSPVSMTLCGPLLRTSHPSFIYAPSSFLSNIGYGMATSSLRFTLMPMGSFLNTTGFPLGSSPTWAI